MRVVVGFLSFALFAPLAIADDATKAELLKLERQLKAAHENVGPSLACVVVSRSDKYPKPATAPIHAGQLGGFDKVAFLKADPNQKRLADRLDLANPDGIPDHGFTGGAVVDSSGLILVHNRAIEGATKIFVHLPGTNGSYADIRAADARSDLAVLKLRTPPTGLKPVQFGRVRTPDFAGDAKATLFPGKVGLLMANPFASGFGMNQPSAGLATASTIRRLERPAVVAQPMLPMQQPAVNIYLYYHYAPLLEYDARFNPGCSGAAFLNLDGEVVAFTTSTAGVIGGEAGPRHAMPCDDNFQRIVDVLKRGEEVEYGFLGIQKPDDLPNFPVRPTRGIPIAGITPGSPAAAKFDPATDVAITHINDRAVRTFEDLLLHVGSGLAGGTLHMKVEQRNGQSREVDVVLAKFKNEESYLATVRPEPVFGLRVDHASVLAQSLGGIRGFGMLRFQEIPAGVMVRELLPDSPAAAKFKAIGENNRWVVTQVNGIRTPTPAEFYKAAKGRPSLKLTVIDPTEVGSRPREVTLP